MLITCPTCSAVYRVPEDAIGPNGRNLQCDACGAQWRQRLEDAIPEIEEAAPPAEPDAAETGIGAEDAEAAPAARRRTPGLDEAAELLSEMREESAREDANPIFGDEGGREIPPPPPIEKKKPVVTEDEIRRTMAEDAKAEAEVASARAATRPAEAPGAAAGTTIAPAHEGRSGGGGFRVGFVLGVIVIAALAFAYVAQDLLAAQFPGAAGPLAAYADIVDGIRSQVERLAAGVMDRGATASE